MSKRARRGKAKEARETKDTDVDWSNFDKVLRGPPWAKKELKLTLLSGEKICFKFNCKSGCNAPQCPFAHLCCGCLGNTGFDVCGCLARRMAGGQQRV